MFSYNLLHFFYGEEIRPEFIKYTEENGWTFQEIHFRGFFNEMTTMVMTTKAKTKQMELSILKVSTQSKALKTINGRKYLHITKSWYPRSTKNSQSSTIINSIAHPQMRQGDEQVLL